MKYRFAHSTFLTFLAGKNKYPVNPVDALEDLDEEEMQIKTIAMSLKDGKGQNVKKNQELCSVKGELLKKAKQKQNYNPTIPTLSICQMMLRRECQQT